MIRVETAVVGAGPAGASAAIHLARAGRDVLLIDRSAPPKDKLCGEFLSPESAADLAALGLEDELRTLDAPAISAARFTTPSGSEARFPLPGPGRGLSRRALDAMLWSAADEAGAGRHVGEVKAVDPRRGRIELTTQGPEGSKLVVADRLVAAHGRHRGLDRLLDPDAPAPKLRRYAAFKRHHWPDASADAALAEHVEIHVFSGGYCGMSHVEDGRVNVCALVETTWLKRQTDRSWPALLAAMASSQPRLQHRADQLTPDPERAALSVSAIDLGRQRARLGPALVVGDASAVIAPLAGDGQAMALSGGRRLAELLLELGPTAPFERLASRWDQRFTRTYTRRLRVARSLQSVLERPWAAESLVRLGAAFPGIGAGLAVLTREAAERRPPSREA